MRRLLLVTLCVTLLGLGLLAQPANDQAADEVIAITKAQWAAEMSKDTTASMKILADEYTEFNPDYPTRLDGKAINVKLSEAFAGDSGSLVAADMVNPKVQVYGDVAILSYNYIGAVKNKDGEVESTKAKSTRVYVKMGGEWKLVHANFAPVD